jgi:hypothetical protein
MVSNLAVSFYENSTANPYYYVLIVFLFIKSFIVNLDTLFVEFVCIHELPSQHQSKHRGIILRFSVKRLPGVTIYLLSDTAMSS